jgi:hypothetical protein
MSREKATFLEAVGWVLAGLIVMYALAKFAYDYR